MGVVEQMPSEFDTAPTVALDCIAAHQGPVLVDLDETLYLRNSTEDFLDLARPRLLAALLLRLLDAVQPWRWTGGEQTRDVWRVRLVRTLFPWVRLQWRRSVKGLARAFGNVELMRALERHGAAPIIVTSGFHPIVTPLVAALGLADAPIVASRLDRHDDRVRGKLACVIDSLGEPMLRRSLLITDSLQDIAVLRACLRPVRTRWPGAYCRRAHADVYLPGEYLTRVKRPGAHYIRRGILQEDFVFWVLSSIALAMHPALHVLGLLLLLVSFWAIYERGYVDNDLAAVRYEQEPKLELAFWDGSVAIPRVGPWLWAFATGALGIFAVRWPVLPDPSDFARWAAVLIGTYLWFKLYNRLDKGTRVWMYAGLQLARVGAFVVLVPVLPIGAVALGANALSRWVPYHLYRSTGNRWPHDDDVPLIRLTYFVVLGALVGLAMEPAMVFNWTALVLLAWNVYRARHALRTMVANLQRLDRSGGHT